MAEPYVLDPDLGFINDVSKLGGEDVKKCFQCATCAVVCPISPDEGPFPRKEMIASSWGLKDKVVGSSDVWLCHNCGDCSSKCPRGAKPGEVLSALRMYTIQEYATPKPLAQMVNDPTGGLANGERFDFFHQSGGFTFTVGAGLEYRVKMFAAFAELAVTWWEGPSPGTHPRDFSNGEVMVAYPISVGFAMKF